jgi:hypothetical protein
VVIAHLPLDWSGVTLAAAGLAPDFEYLCQQALMKEGALLRGEKSRR